MTVNSDNELAIKVHDVSKTFRLPHEKTNSIKSLLINFRKRRTYEKQRALEHISFEIKKGEFFGIVGRNGSGKSTLLKLLAGIYTPTKGSIEVIGNLTPFIELGVGFNPELTGKENVFLNGALLGFNRKHMQAMYNDIVSFAELERFMDQKLKNYSSGMQVRLAFSIAIRAESDILLIDEVLAVGDQSFQEKCFRYFSEIKNSSKTVVFVTHDMSNVERFCDQVLVLDSSVKNTGVLSIPAAVTRYNELNHPTSTEDTEDEAVVANRKRETNGPYIDKVELINKDNRSTKRFRHGDPMTVRIKLGKSGKDTLDKTKVVVGLAFRDADNINLAGPNSKAQHFNLETLEHEFTIPSLPFNMGEYKLTVALYDEYVATQYDTITDIPFFINTDEVLYGKIKLDASWK